MTTNNFNADCAGLESPRVATAFGCPRDFLENRFVYTVISPRARGLSIGINVNPDKYCNFDCVYCEVDRTACSFERSIDVDAMAAGLHRTLLAVDSGQIRQRPAYRAIAPELLQLRHVALSGDGEPTLCPNFAEVVEAVVHVRARNPYLFFKLVLITNGSGLDQPPARRSLQYFTPHDEIWIKLDAGTQKYMDLVNRSEVRLEKVVANALLIGRQRPIVIQSLFACVDSQEPPAAEIDAYIERLLELKSGGARIANVQIYSASRPTSNGRCGHLPLRFLSALRQRIKAIGLNAEVF